MFTEEEKAERRNNRLERERGLSVITGLDPSGIAPTYVYIDTPDTEGCVFRFLAPYDGEVFSIVIHVDEMIGDVPITLRIISENKVVEVSSVIKQGYNEISEKIVVKKKDRILVLTDAKKVWMSFLTKAL